MQISTTFECNWFTGYYGILFGCPYGNRLPSCPLINIDAIQDIDRIDWFLDLDVAEKYKIIKEHICCSQYREYQLKK